MLDERNEGGPDRYTTQEVLRPVDRVQQPHPASWVVGGRSAALLAEHCVPWPPRPQHHAYRVLDGQVSVGDRGPVGLAADPQISCARPVQRDTVGGVSQGQG